MAATGRLTTKMALPMMVAAKPKGLARTASAAVTAGSGVPWADAGVTLVRARTAANRIAKALLFIITVGQGSKYGCPAICTVGGMQASQVLTLTVHQPGET